MPAVATATKLVFLFVDLHFTLLRRGHYYVVTGKDLQGVSTAFCAEPCIIAVVGMSVRLSIRLSHAATVSKQRKLGSQDLHRQIAQLP